MNLSKLTFNQALKLASPETVARITGAYHKALERAWRASGTRETFTPSSAAHLFPSIKARYAPVLHLVRDPNGDLQRLITRLAQNVICVRQPGIWTTLHTSFINLYASQGFGAEKYAECYAELWAAFAESNGIPAKVQSKHDVPGGSFSVAVETDWVGVRLLLQKTWLPKREAVRLCWANGCQPRVFFPFLPADFEEANGLDYFGGEKRAASAA